MTIGEEAKAWFEQYEQHEGHNSFAAVLVRCLLYGILVKRPEFILMAEPVLTDGQRILAFGPAPVLNCWFVYYFATKQKFSPITPMNEAPYQLPYIGLKRRGKIKVYHWEKIRRDFRHGVNFLERQG